MSNRGLVILLLATLAVLLLSVVGLVGYWYGKKTTQPATSTGNSLKQSPQSRFPEEPSSELVEETSGWMTFTNEDITFKYPSGWELGQREVFGSSNNQQVKTPDGIYSLFIEARINYDNSTGKPFLNPLEMFADPKRQKQETTVDGEPAVKTLPYEIFSGQPENATIISLCFLSKDENAIYTFEFTTKSADMARVRNGSAIFEQIVSTLKFSTAKALADEFKDWKVYRSTKYSFSIKYPESFFKEEEVNTSSAQVYALVSREEFGVGSEPIHYRIDFGELKNPSKLSFKDLATLGLDENLKSSFIYSQKTVGQYTAYTTESLPSRSGELNTFITKDGSRYLSITFSPYDSKRPFEGQKKYFGIFDQILSTFKFLE